MSVSFLPTVHRTLHAIGIAPVQDAAKLRRSIASRAGRLGVGNRLRLVEQIDGDNVRIHVAYNESKAV